jgi:hypothetical protein
MGETIVHARVRHPGRRDHDPAHPAQVGPRARVEGRDASLELLLELDLGTENLGRLEEKMERYEILAGAATAPSRRAVLFPE